MIIPNNWRPRWYQKPLWMYLENGGKRALQVAHRRWGKDDVCLHWTSRCMWDRVGTYWHMLPIAKQARKAIWDAMNPHTGKRRIDEAFPVELRSVTREDEMFIKNKNGSTWQVLGSDNYESFIGSPPVGLVFSEWAQANPLAWAFTRPVLAENDGWALFITTPRGKNHVHRMLKMAQADGEQWYANVQGVKHTRAIKPAILKNELKEMQDEFGDEQGLSLYEQEYDCSFEAAVIGSVYGAWLKDALKDGRVKKQLYDPTLLVHTAWDLGYDDSTFIWFFQIAGSEVRIIDFYENNLQDTAHYCSQIAGVTLTLDFINVNGVFELRCKRGAEIEGLERRRAYKYGDHHVPHDARNKLQAAGGKSIIEQAYACGIQMIAHSAATQENQIAAARITLKTTWWDEDICGDAFETLKQYQFEYDEEKKMFKTTPRHDFTSHPADAYELLALVRQSVKMESKAPQSQFPLHSMQGGIILPDIADISTIDVYKDEF